MHKLNVLIFGPSSFISTLDELKPFLKFNPISDNINVDHDLILIHHEIINDKSKKDLIKSFDSIKIYASKKKNILDNYDAHLELPTNLKEINAIVENIAAKAKFIKNSTIKVKNYTIDLNSREMMIYGIRLKLTEKEINTITYLSKSNKSVGIDELQKKVWSYHSDIETHTVETHIYRLRKKISNTFNDNKFIISEKNGYQIK